MCQHARVRRLWPFITVAVAITFLSGCGASSTTPATIPRAADAQHATLDWVESTGSPNARLVFRVQRFSVTQGGWNAHVSVTNDTKATFAIDGVSEPFRHAFGLMLFRTGSHDELERRNADYTLPVLREAMTFEPALPKSLGPSVTWSGTLSSRGALPSGAWVRLVFGVFTPEGPMPAGLAPAGNAVVTWITDHAHRLQ